MADFLFSHGSHTMWHTCVTPKKCLTKSQKATRKLRFASNNKLSNTMLAG